MLERVSGTYTGLLNKYNGFSKTPYTDKYGEKRIGMGIREKEYKKITGKGFSAGLSINKAQAESIAKEYANQYILSEIPEVKEFNKQGLIDGLCSLLHDEGIEALDIDLDCIKERISKTANKWFWLKIPQHHIPFRTLRQAIRLPQRPPKQYQIYVGVAMLGFLTTLNQYRRLTEIQRFTKLERYKL